MTDKKSTFLELREIDVSPFVEKKNNFNYLSWAWALEQMYLYDPDAEYTFPEREVFPDNTVMIYCDVTIKGKTKRGWLPAMDYNNRAVKNPDARKISDTKMRCLVKTIALHGLGLGLYAGEDLPDKEKDQPNKETKTTVIEARQINLKDTPKNPAEMAQYAQRFIDVIKMCDTVEKLDKTVNAYSGKVGNFPEYLQTDINTAIVEQKKQVSNV